MKIIRLVFLCFFLVTNATAQYTQLIPSMKPALSGSKVNVPDYGSLLITFQNEVKLWADINCQNNLNKQLNENIKKARNIAKSKTTYVVLANITNKVDCKIQVFRPKFQNENLSVIHDPNQKILLYTIDIYPWIEINGKNY